MNGLVSIVHIENYRINMENTEIASEHERHGSKRQIISVSYTHMLLRKKNHVSRTVKLSKQNQKLTCNTI